jgi:hypothetical protein
MDQPNARRKAAQTRRKEHEALDGAGIGIDLTFKHELSSFKAVAFVIKNSTTGRRKQVKWLARSRGVRKWLAPRTCWKKKASQHRVAPTRAEVKEWLHSRMGKKKAKDKQSAAQLEFEGIGGCKLGMPKFASQRRADNYKRIKTTRQ